MRHETILAPSAVRELAAQRADVRGRVRDAIERHLRHEPTQVSRSRIKRLRGLERPLEVLAIIPKSEAEARLRTAGSPSKAGGAGSGEG